MVFILQKCNSEMRLGFVLQLVTIAWNACTPAARLRTTQIALNPYLSYNNRPVMIDKIGSFEYECAPQSRRSICARTHGVVVLGESEYWTVSQEAFECRDP